MHRDDKRDFEALALPHMDAVYRGAIALCRNPDAAQDLLQTTYLKAWQSFGSFQAGTNCKAWLMRILRNTWIDLLRRQGLVRTIALDEQLQVASRPEPQDPPAEDANAGTILEKFSDQQVIEALGQLGEDQRLTLLLVDVEQLDYEQVARIMDIPAGTVKSRTSRARAALREALYAHAKDLGFLGR